MKIRGLIMSMICVTGILGGAVVSPAADERVLRIMPLGDSITAGYFAGKGGYRDQLRTLLMKKGFNVDFVGRSVDKSDGIADPEHEGYSGATIDQIAGKADEALPKFEPDIILLFAGTNDIRVNGENDKPSDPLYWKTAPKRFEKLLDVIRNRSPKAVVLVGTVMPFTGGWAKREDVAREFNAELKKIVEKEKASGANIHLVDFRKTIDEKDLADGIHPNEQGYEKMAKAWCEAITTITKKESQKPKAKVPKSN